MKYQLIMEALGLQVVLSPPSISPPTSSQPESTVSVGVTVHNPADTTATLLNWGTPFDPLANVLGVFTVEDAGTGEAVPIDTIQVSRKLPAAPDDLLQLPAKTSLDTVVQLPPLPLVTGHEYTIHAEGIWHAVWEGRLEEVTPAQLEDLSDAKRGDFSSNTVAVRVE